MIVEFFGPPGVGKTTLAVALSNRLRQGSSEVELVTSYRPREKRPLPLASRERCGRASDAIQRLARPTKEMLLTAIALSASSRETTTASKLMMLLPPGNAIWSLRLRQYLLRLSRSWHACRPPKRITIYDQAFVQAVCSLVLLTPTVNHRHAACALKCIPAPDLLVQLSAPNMILEERLIERERHQSKLERWLEFDLATNLRSITVLDQLRTILAQQGRSVLQVPCGGRRSLNDAVGDVEQLVMQAHRESLVA